MRLADVMMAAVTTYEPRTGLKELAGYYGPRPGRQTWTGRPSTCTCASTCRGTWCRPFLEELPVIPMLPSGKADRRNLPEPGGSGRIGAEGPCVEPDTPVEKALADALAELLGVPQVSVDSQFFDEQGMTSLIVAHFCAQVREREDTPPVSVKDVYLQPTIRSLAETIDELPSVTVTASQPEPARYGGPVLPSTRPADSCSW